MAQQTPIPFSVRVVDGGVTVQQGAKFAVAVQEDTIRVVKVLGPPGVVQGVTVTTINGQLVVTLVDTTRGDKILSVAEQPLPFTENALADLDWISPGNATDAGSGYIADLDGTIVFCTAHCEDTGANMKDIHLFINGVDQGSVGTLSGGANAKFENLLLNLDFDKGDRIRARAVGSSGKIQDTTVKVTVKWRG